MYNLNYTTSRGSLGNKQDKVCLISATKTFGYLGMMMTQQTSQLYRTVFVPAAKWNMFELNVFINISPRLMQ